MMRAIATTATAVVLSAVLFSCGEETAEKQAVSSGTILIRGAGATFPEPLYQRWIEDYQAARPEVLFDYEGVGSGEGIKRFIAGSVDFGASDAAMKDEEMAQVAAGVKLVPVTAGMVVLAYNLPGVEGELKLTRDVYVDIFLSKISRWDDPRIVVANPDLDLPAKLIQPIVRRDSSGTTYAFTNHLSTISAAWTKEGPGTAKLIDWPGAAMTGIGNEGVAQKVKISHGSIGYMEYGFARRLGLSVATLENKAGNFVRPTADTGRNALAGSAEADPQGVLRMFLPDPEGAASYPIVSLSWILLYGKYGEPAKAAVLKEALRWGLTEGQTIAEDMGYVPLPEVIVLRAAQVVSSIQ